MSTSQASATARNQAMIADWMAGTRQVDLAEKYGVSQGTVSKVCSGGSPAALRAEIRRLREAVTDYFVDRDRPQEVRDRNLFESFATDSQGSPT